jgi:hypothetical protein
MLEVYARKKFIVIAITAGTESVANIMSDVSIARRRV